MKPSIALDFDGVIHSYSSGWQGTVEEMPDDPVPGAADAIRSYLGAGFDVFVFSTRGAWSGGRMAMYRYLTDRLGLTEHEALQVRFAAEKPNVDLFVDDRGYHFTGSNFPSPEFVRNFRPWNK